MKRVVITLLCILSTALMSGCGGGGGSSVGPTTKATTKMFLFGAMSSNTRFGVYSSSGKIASVQTSMTVPSGIMVNYSSPAPAGYPANSFPLRKGFVVPSGPVRVAATDFTGTFDTSSRILTISLVNLERALLKSTTVGNGAEIATINFTLASPGVEPPMPLADPLVIVSQERPTQPVSVDYLTGCKTNFSTTFH